tara:strand:+ start:107012 stop:107902 length:891 start_codon:yes stop_codon:yes gene_type:complete
MSFRLESENYKYWTLEEDQRLEQLVNLENLSFKEIGKLLNRTGQSCQDHSVILGLKSNYVKRTYKVNETFWDTPDKTNCYWAGIFLADGNIQYKGEKSCALKWEISTKDEPHISRFLKDSDCDASLNYQTREKGKTVRIGMNCPEWKVPLKDNFGLIPNKTRRMQSPNVYDNFLKLCLIIGYIDGDGCIYYNIKTDQVGIKIDSSSYLILEWIKESIMDNFSECCRVKRRSNVRKLKHAECYEISFCGIRACAIIDYLRQFPVPKLDRKWNNPKVLEYVENQKQKFPHLFLNKFTL